MEQDGPVDTPAFYTQILQDFAEEVAEEAEQKLFLREYVLAALNKTQLGPLTIYKRS